MSRVERDRLLFFLSNSLGPHIFQMRSGVLGFSSYDKFLAFQRELVNQFTAIEVWRLNQFRDDLVGLPVLNVSRGDIYGLTGMAFASNGQLVLIQGGLV